MQKERERERERERELKGFSLTWFIDSAGRGRLEQSQEQRHRIRADLCITAHGKRHGTANHSPIHTHTHTSTNPPSRTHTFTQTRTHATHPSLRGVTEVHSYPLISSLCIPCSLRVLPQVQGGFIRAGVVLGFPIGQRSSPEFPGTVANPTGAGVAAGSIVSFETMQKARHLSS